MTNLESKVIQLETAKRLYEAGVTMKALTVWFKCPYDGEFCVYDGDYIHGARDYEHYEAYNLHELMEVMPGALPDNAFLQIDRYDGVYCARYIATRLGYDEEIAKEEEDKNPLRSLEALALYLLDHSMWPNTKEV